MERLTDAELNEIEARCEAIKAEGTQHPDYVMASVEVLQLTCFNVDRLLFEVKQLRAELSESQRRERAAVADLSIVVDGIPCDVCKHVDEVPCTQRSDGRCWEWRGPQQGANHAE